MTEPQKNLRDAVLKSEGKNSPDEKGVEFTVKDNEGETHVGIFEYYDGLPDVYEILEKFESDCDEMLNESSANCQCQSRFDEGELVGVRYISGEITLSRILLALGKLAGEYVVDNENMDIDWSGDPYGTEICFAYWTKEDGEIYIKWSLEENAIQSPETITKLIELLK